MKELVDYAKAFIGTDYKWGGEGPQGLDCSGFVQVCLRSVGVDPPGDQTAKGLYGHFLTVGLKAETGAGALVFYGANSQRISHVALMINKIQVIEAAGGGSQTKTEEDAERDRAFVRIRPYNYRSDVVGVLMPNYPQWVING